MKVWVHQNLRVEMCMNIGICELLNLIHFKMYMNSIGFTPTTQYTFIIFFFIFIFSIALLDSVVLP